MKFLLFILLAVMFGVVLHAQTNLTLTTATAPQAPTQILSDTVDFNLKTRVAIYRGNVRVDDPQMKLRCETLTATAPPGGGRIESIVAETNVVIDVVDDGKTNHATGNKLVYTFKVENGVTNEMARLTGNPRIDSPDGWLEGDVIIWDRASSKVHAEGKISTGSRGTNSIGLPFSPVQAPPQ